MFFNIEFYRPYMSPEDLLRVEPEVLAKLILHKRELITQKLPGTIETIADQKLTAEKLARQSRTKKDDLEPKVNNLIKERQNVVREIKDKLHSNSTTNDEIPIDSETIQKLLTPQVSTEQFVNLLDNLIESYNKNEGNPVTLEHYQSSVKANDALKQVITEFEQAKVHWNENEAHRRKLESKFTKLSSSLKESNRAKEYWNEKLSSSLDELLVDAKRVAAGGQSSRQILRNNKPNNRQRRG